MGNRRWLAVLAALAVLVTGCASGSGGTGSRPSVDRNVLTRDQIQDVSVNSAFEAIQRLRPSWLRVRGASSTRGATGIVVYFDGVRAGGLEALQTMRVDQILELRFINSRDATTRWGTGHTAGAIEVRTR